MQIGKIIRQIILNDYIYTMWQKDMVNHFLDFIYIQIGKRCGKSSEIHIHNYRQLQMQIKRKQAYKYNYKYNYRYIYIAIQRIKHSKYNIKIAQKQYKTIKILTVKKHKNHYKQHNTIIAIDIQKIQLQKSLKSFK